MACPYFYTAANYRGRAEQEGMSAIKETERQRSVFYIGRTLAGTCTSFIAYGIAQFNRKFLEIIDVAMIKREARDLSRVLRILCWMPRYGGGLCGFTLSLIDCELALPLS